MVEVSFFSFFVFFFFPSHEKSRTKKKLPRLSGSYSKRATRYKPSPKQGLAHLGSSLRELWLGRNRIEDSAPPPQPLERGSSSPASSSSPPASSSLLYRGLAPLTRLERLSLQSNRLASMAQLPPLPSLKELYLSHNGIRRLENLSGFPMLKVLDASSNALEDVSDLARGSGTLTDLWLNDNRIGGGGGGGGGGEGGKEASGGEGGEAGEGAGERKDPSSSSSTPLQTVEAAVLSHLRASGSSRTVTCMYLARNPVSVDAPAGLMSRRPRPVAAAAAAAAAGASSSSSVLRNSGVGGSSSSAAAAAAAAFDEEEGLRAERRAARAAFVRELAAALPALAELDGDDLPAGARV